LGALIPVLDRREFVRTAGLLAAGAALRFPFAEAAAAGDHVDLPFENGGRDLVAYPQKRPLIRLTTRPPQLETPFAVFNEGPITPNDAFFVRYHLAGIPMSIDEGAYRLRVRGLVRTPLELSIADLKAVAEPVELTAVNQCSGNSRGFFYPRVGGGQLGNGAMGNARWVGVPLKVLLEKAGASAGARQVTFAGLDRPVLEATPAFVKALDIDHALDGEVMIAYEMNGRDLPMLNGYPARLIVPGYFGTYWVKHLSEITVVDRVFDGYWMKTAYRVPDNETHSVPPGTVPAATVPIGQFAVRSFITNFSAGDRVPARSHTRIQGIAFDGGRGIDRVEFSPDGGATWDPASLGPEISRYSFREWTAFADLSRQGEFDLRVRATNRAGETQPLEPRWNPGGYMRNVVETIKIQTV
jgi:sulfite dehydrogenase (cytochrome) subunit A